MFGFGVMKIGKLGKMGGGKKHSSPSDGSPNFHAGKQLIEAKRQAHAHANHPKKLVAQLEAGLKERQS